MPLPKINPTQTKAWKKLEAHHREIQDTKLQSLFETDSQRGAQFKIEWEDFYVDFSKNHLNAHTLELLDQLAQECQLSTAIEQYYGGERINVTENRAVLHTALRADASKQILFDNENVVPEVHMVLDKIDRFCASVIDGKKLGATGKKFTDVVNIGIGGSDLGPVMVTEALEHYRNHLGLHFISNVDGDHVQEILKKVDPETTLFVVVSKSFTTQETLANATTAKKWLTDALGTDAVAAHFVAVSTNLPMIDAFGIDPDNVFPMNDWVGGRFSLWSAVGLTIALGIGPKHFRSLLEGARKMDDHFAQKPIKENIPLVLALITIWYNNFFGAESEAIIPYAQYLHRLPAYLQQGIMESNGKSIDRNGQPVTYQTGNLIWGEPGTNAQHAFFQLIHQGTKTIPAHFIGFKKSLFGYEEHHQKLMANFFAQTEALMQGKSETTVREEGVEEVLVPFKIFEGNKPTTTLLIDKLTPESLGKLVAMYEHKIFVEGIIWNIYSYDQWGVELGKQLANSILNELQSGKEGQHDSSTYNLLSRYKS
ncbi:MAG: glucose-6-phosphate isomerase [Flavobacteriaceae bacterium]